jgi:hypothetical protein
MESYRSVLFSMGGNAGSAEADTYVDGVQRAIDDTAKALLEVGDRYKNSTVDSVKGFVAEDWHAGTLKVSAAARDVKGVWAEASHATRGPEQNIDIRFGDASHDYAAQSKYYRGAAETTKAISHPEYQGEVKIVPEDQLEGVKEAARREAARNAPTRPEQSEQYQDTASTATDRLEIGKAQSKPLSETDAKDMARELKRGSLDREKHGLNTEHFVGWEDVFRESSEAALHAAILSAALRTAVVNRYIHSGTIDPDDFLIRGKDVLTTGAYSGLRGGVAACLTASCRAGLLGATLKSVPPVGIGAATTITLNAIQYGLQLHAGQIDGREFAQNCIRDTFVIAGGVLGASLGQALIPIPIVGAIAGNIVGSTMGVIVYQGGQHAILGICIESGWTFFGLVQQDYVVPDEVLRQAGYDLITVQSFETQSFSTESFSDSSFSINSLGIAPVRRGVIGCTRVGYIQ